ncbi:TMV resistance protein [Vigna angularis]|uniref:TMV resistance protein n=1 Tax=Phaseolus angularis TaxID=3914 RepID=A0A8T0LFW4_PHAAN|nr:disease resistance protein RPV1 isoform X2 [Vigna angularis]KAG2411116.1 TMV resistance protein [Vigna angularis]
MAESSSSLAVPTSPTKYDVFLSFRGEDTRHNFVSHLHAALHRNHIEAYIDEREQKGEEISPALQTAIEESKIYVLVFSENYASSTWCLNELSSILNCKKRYRRDVIPIFYKVDPSTVRKQEKRYKAAFEEYEQRFKDDMDKVQGWKDALTEAAGLSGWDSNVIRGHEEIVVAERLEDCGFSSLIGIDVLKDKCLISVLDGRIMMHDLIQDMGQEIIRKECPQHPGKRSRLLKVDEIHEVLSKNKGSDAIQSILVDVGKMEEVEVHAQTFEVMNNLRMLMLYYSTDINETKVFRESSLVGLPDTLKILYWTGFPQRSLPPNFYPENLVRLEMPNCHLEQLWEGDQNLPKLKRLNLSGSQKLTGIPDLYLSPNIEEIIFSDCPKLIKVYSSILLSKLSCLCLDSCLNLKSVTVPSNILSTSPGLILFSGCDKLEMFSIGQPHVKLKRQRETFSIFPREEPKYQRRTFLRSSYIPERAVYDYFSTCSDIFSIIFDRYEEEENEVTDNNIYEQSHTLSTELEEGVPLNFPSLKKLCFINFFNCSSLTTFPCDLSETKFLKQLCLCLCLKLENFPEIEDTVEGLAVLILDGTAIQALPSSLWRLVGLEQLSLRDCKNLEIIPSSIGSLTRLCKLDLTYCKSLQTFPSTIFNLKLRKLDLCGCLKLKTFPEITEQAQTFAHINLTETAIKDLPSSFGNLINLRSLQLNKCRDLELLPNSIVNLKHLCKLDCSGCAKLTEIPTHIGSLSSLMELSLSESGIVNLPESIANLTSLKSLDLSGCKNLECIPKIPTFLKQLVALDCPSIRQVRSNSLVQNLSNSKESFFNFHLTNAQQLDSGARANIEEDARLRMSNDAYRSVFFCFSGSAIPHWFRFRGKGRSVTINEDLSFCNDDRVIGFALCVVFGLLDTNDIEARRGYFSYSLKFESDDGGTHIIPNNDLLKSYFKWNGEERPIDQDHTFMWKFNLESLKTSSMSLRLCDASSFTFEINPLDFDFRWPNYDSVVGEFKSVVTIKECGICPLYRSGSNVTES